MASRTGHGEPLPDDTQPIANVASERVREPHDTVRIITMVGAIVCAFIQMFSLAAGDMFFLGAVGALLFWFFYTNRITPLYILFVGILVFRLGMIANYRDSAFRDLSADDFLFHLVDNVSFVCLTAFGFLYFELAPERLASWKGRLESGKSGWYRLEPFSGLLVRMPIAVTLALLTYFLSGQIQSPIDRRILAPRFAQTYLVVLILFLGYLLFRTLIGIWSWRTLTAEQARFYLRNQVGQEMGQELDELKKPAWSRIDHASAVGGMFLLQWIAAAILAVILITTSRFTGNSSMWPAVAALFVFLTAVYNAIRAARSDIVAADQHVIAFAGFVVASAVGFLTLSELPIWPWRMLYLGWLCFNGLILIRMVYLWLLDEEFARRNGWETARPFSLVRTSAIVSEGVFASGILYIVGSEILVQLV